MVVRAFALLFAAGCVAAAQDVTDLLPDMIVNVERLEDNEVRSDIKPGKTHLVLSNGTANIGEGPLEIAGVKPKVKDHDEILQKVKQRIYRSDGSHYTLPAGFFVYHPSHNHTHFEDWALYRLRVVLPGDQVGAVLAESKKTSFCLLDSFVYDETNPGIPPDRVYTNCSGRFQGISPGYEDVYDKSLPDQWIDITDIPDGTYWLESIVDPVDNVLELDETNNEARIKVIIDVNPDAEPNPVGILEFLRQLLERILELFGASFSES